MSQLLEKVKSTPHICAVYVDFLGEAIPSHLTEWQSFYDSSIKEADFKKTYIGLGSVAFSENSQESRSGTTYLQKLSITFPTADKYRSERIEYFRKVKNIKIELTNGQSFVLGRNDFFQNRKPKLKTSSDHNLTKIEFDIMTIFPTGFEQSQLYGLPTLIPFIVF